MDLEPRFVLISRVQQLMDRDAYSSSGAPRYGWRFLLRSSDGTRQMDVADEEPHVSGERLELLAVVRGLEALEQPSRVQLLTDSRYVIRGLRFGLPQWKETDWCWELHGQMVAVRDGDLWQRIDRALEIHQVRYRWVRLDTIVASRAGNSAEISPSHGSGAVPAPHWVRRRMDRSRYVVHGSAARRIDGQLVQNSLEQPQWLRICSPDDDE
jgi:ribonuclease HI